MTTHDRPKIKRRVRRGIEVGKQKYSGSSADVLWHRLNSVDFLNQGMIFAGTLLLCAFPFLIVADSLAGRSAATELGRRLGLNRQTADDFGHLFTSSHTTVASVTGVSWVFLILSAFAVAASLQGLYQRIFGLDSRGPRDIPRALIWLVLEAAWLYAAGLIGPRSGHWRAALRGRAGVGSDHGPDSQADRRRHSRRRLVCGSLPRR
jgi:membrane protein